MKFCFPFLIIPNVPITTRIIFVLRFHNLVTFIIIINNNITIVIVIIIFVIVISSTTFITLQ